MTTRHILSTGQRLCFDTAGRPVDCAGTGQDGEFRTGEAWPEPRFEPQGEALALDRLTGLVWPRTASLGDFPMSWTEALSAVKLMNEENAFGHADWRLPNRRELSSLVSYSHHRPALPTGHPFTVSQTWYWTSTTADIAPDCAWRVHLEGGRMFYGDKTRDAMVWPVRGESAVLARTGQRRCRDAAGTVIDCAATGQDGALRSGVPWPEPRFAMEEDGVRDLLTGLLWTRSTDQCGVCAWEEALREAKERSKKAANGVCRPSANSSPWLTPSITTLPCPNIPSRTSAKPTGPRPAAPMPRTGPTACTCTRGPWAWVSRPSGNFTPGSWPPE